jgi:ATP-dependent exoDNAse (exonuclease V) alpha subunit
LNNLGIQESELEDGFLCDTASKSELKILARPGIVVRLTRNLDKHRGFVNGATGVVEYSLRGNAVFVVRLVGTGNLVLVHPMYEDGATFLPCCYGYATTVRRAQGASLDHGCVYFDQKKHHAGRGYGYVAVSRFKTRAGVHVYGKLRRTDFLPVGDEQDDEVLERGWSSANTSEDEDKEHAKGIAARYAAESSDEEEYLAGGSDDEQDDDCAEYMATLDSGDEGEQTYLNSSIDFHSPTPEVSADWA